MQCSESGCQQVISCRRSMTLCVCAYVLGLLMSYKSPGRVAGQTLHKCYLLVNMNLGFTAPQLTCLDLCVCVRGCFYVWD